MKSSPSCLPNFNKLDHGTIIIPLIKMATSWIELNNCLKVSYQVHNKNTYNAKLADLIITVLKVSGRTSNLHFTRKMNTMLGIFLDHKMKCSGTGNLKQNTCSILYLMDVAL